MFSCNPADQSVKGEEKKPIEQTENPLNSKTFQPMLYVKLTHPEWSKNTTINEVNLRKYSQEGTFKAFKNHFPRSKDKGIDIIWLMHQ